MNSLVIKTRRHRSEEGFTLTELVIVMVIIGILAAIAVPIYSNQQKAAHISGLKQDISSTVVALATWQQGQGFKAVPTYGTATSQFETKIRVQSGDNKISLVVYSSQKDPENGTQFCIQGERVLSGTDIAKWYYNTHSKAMKEGVCVAAPDLDLEPLS